MRVGEVVIAAGVQTRQPLALLPGKEEEVTLKVSAPLVDPKKIELTSVFKTNQVIAGKPTGSDFTDAVMFAPGVVSGLGTGDGNWSIGGSSGFENSYIVDGVNVTDSGFGSVNSYNFVYGTLGAGVTTDILDEVQVKTAGFDAEYGQALGGIVTGVIKSGTNHLSGTVRASATEFSAGEQVSFVRAAANTDWEASRDANLALTAGGPLVKDRLFAFAAFNPLRTTRQVTIQRVTNPILELDPGAAATYPDANPYPASLTPGREIERTRYNYAAKLTWNASASQRVEFVAFGDPSTGDGRNGLRNGDIIMTGLADTDGDGTGDAEVTKQAASFGDGGGWSDIEYGAQQYSASYDGVLGDDWFLEAQVAYRRNTFEETSTVDDFRYRDYGDPRVVLRRGDALRSRHLRGRSRVHRADRGQVVGRRGQGEQDPRRPRPQVRGRVLRPSVHAGENCWSGPRRDYSFPRIDGTSFTMRGLSGGWVDILGGIPGCDACVIATGPPQYRVHNVQFSEDRPTTGYEWALFVQDTWSIGDHWVLKMGVRATAQTLRGAGDYT